MAAVTKTLVVLCALIVGCAVPATSLRQKDPTVRYSYTTEVVQLAYEKWTDALAELEKKVDACGNERKKTVIPSQALPVLPLSHFEWGVALTHLSARAMNRCVGNLVGDALLAYTRFRDFEKQVTGGNAVDTGDFDVELLCCMSVFGQMETELEYKKIDPKIRQTLESIPELNQPFHPIHTQEAMSQDARFGNRKPSE